MAKIQQGSVIDRIVKGLRLDSVREKVPDQSADKVVPVFNSNIPLPVVREITDTASNDSDKTISVPSGKAWKVKLIHASLATTANVGNRSMQLNILDPSSNNVFVVVALNVQVASTTENYNYIPGQNAPTEATGGTHIIPIPVDLILPEDFSIRIRDVTGVDAAADDLTIRMIVEEYDYVLN